MAKFNEFFDDVVVNAKAAASVVGRKASVLADNAGQRFSAAELRSEINKKLRYLGALTYKTEVHGADLSEAIKRTVAEIIDLKESLNVINEAINSTKETEKCSHCGASVPAKSVFCNVCGGRMDEEDEADFVMNEDTAE